MKAFIPLPLELIELEDIDICDFQRFNKDIAYQHIQAGLEQLRSLGLGHGDIKVNNIFVDDTNIAFLDDLEYCTPLGTIIPK